jgi:hypothetical protein
MLATLVAVSLVCTYLLPETKGTALASPHAPLAAISSRAAPR